MPGNSKTFANSWAVLSAAPIARCLMEKAEKDLQRPPRKHRFPCIVLYLPQVFTVAKENDNFRFTPNRNTSRRPSST